MRLTDFSGRSGKSGGSPGYGLGARRHPFSAQVVVNMRQLPPQIVSANHTPTNAVKPASTNNQSLSFPRVLLLISLSIWSVIGFASPVSFYNCMPYANSEISTFNFMLEFDISGAIEEAGPGEWGIGYSGSSRSSSKLKAILYEGEPNGERKELAKALTSNFNGTSDAFVVNGNTVEISYPSSLHPEPGKKYFLEIGNLFGIYKKGTSSLHEASSIQYSSNPLILTFVGAEPSSEELVYQSSSIIADSEYEIIKDIEFTFNAAMNLVEGGKVIILDGKTEEYSTADLRISNDGLTVTASFDKPVTLWKGHSYTIQLTAGSVCLTSDANVVNKLVSIPISGSSFTKIPVKSTTPTDNSKGLFTELSITFNVPEGYTLTPKVSNSAHKRKGILYVNEVSSENLVQNITGKVTEDGTGQTFDLSFLTPTPSTKYIFVKPENEITLWKDGVEAPEYGNDETTISWTTPSVEQRGLDRIVQSKLGTAKIGRHDNSNSTPFTNGESYRSIDILEIESYKYNYEGESYWLNVKTDVKALLYDVTDGTRKLLKDDIMLSHQSRESNYDYYSVISIWPQATFYTGHTYEIVIPKNAMTINLRSIKNYVQSDEMVFRIKGATPTNVSLLSCNIAEGAEVTELTRVLWVFDGDFQLKEDAFALFDNHYLSSATKYPLSAFTSSGKTYVSVDFIDKYYGTHYSFKDGDRECTLTIPAGTIYYPADENIVNDEVSVDFKGVRPSDNTIEFVNTTVTLADNATNEAHSFVVKTAKGYPAEIQLLPGENWNVADVAHEGKSLSAVNGIYSSEPLNEDSKIVATLAYMKDMIFDQSSGVYTVENTDIKVFTENNKIVVAGLTEPTDIAVFTVGGILIKSMRTDAGNDTVAISAEQNQIYVVVINGQAAKIKL